MTNNAGPDGRDNAQRDADSGSENSAADAGSESPEEGQKAMAAAEDATVDSESEKRFVVRSEGVGILVLKYIASVLI